MTKNSHDALRRADMALAGALLLTFVTAGAAWAINPHTEQVPALRPAIVRTAAAEEFARPVATPASVVTPASVIAIAPSPEELAELRLASEEHCLAEAMYYEARGEGYDGEEAIAEVVVHRTHAAGYPGTICGVVYQGSHLDHGCQFSFTCDGELRHAKSPGAWYLARLLAVRFLTGSVALGNTTGGATAFHATEVSPDWSGGMSETVQIGNHIFYRRAVRTQAS